MVGLFRVRWNCRAKTENWNLFIWVIILEDISHGTNGIQVFILLHIKVVKRTWLVWASIWKSEVNCDSESNFTTTEYVLQERVPLVNFKSRECELVLSKWFLLFIRNRVFFLLLFESCKRECRLAHVLMLSRFLWLQEIDTNFPLDVVARQVCS